MMEVFYFSFNIHLSLSLNITFKVFSLSFLCVERFSTRRKEAWDRHLASPQLKNREYVVVYHFNDDLRSSDKRSQKGHHVRAPFYFCHNRAQWSVYMPVASHWNPPHYPHLEFSTCSLCLNIKSTVIFAYQVLESKLFSSYQEDKYYTISGQEQRNKSFLLQLIVSLSILFV